MVPPKIIIEKIWGVKLSNRMNWFVNLFILLFVLLCFWLLPKYSEKQSEKLAENWNKKEFSGIVDSLYSDHSNHAVTSIYFTNGTKQTNLSESYYYAIKKSDSIFKIKSNDTIFIKRENKILKIN